MPDTWNLFAARDILLGGLAAVGFLAVIFTVANASYNVEQRERVLKYAADKKREAEEQDKIEQSLFPPTMCSREKWLLALLTGVFFVQAGTLLYGVNLCARVKPEAEVTAICPKLGERYDNTFNTMIATTLALLTGGAVASAATVRKPPARKP